LTIRKHKLKKLFLSLQTLLIPLPPEPVPSMVSRYSVQIPTVVEPPPPFPGK